MTKNFIFRPYCELCQSDEKQILLSREFSHPSVWDFLATYYEGGIKKHDLVDGKYEIAKCAKCGFIWQTYILNDELMDKLYSVWISPEQSLIKKNHADITLYSAYAREVENISFLLNKKPFEINVLDFGMGWGYWCLMAKAFRYNVSGLELSQERTVFARENAINVIGWSDISSARFDFINAEQVFEHLYNPVETLKLLVCSLRKGGFVRISVPDGRRIEQELRNPEWKASKNAVGPLEHINCFTHKTLLKLGELADLEAKQPFPLSRGYNLGFYLKGILKKYYHRFFPGTRLYFATKT